MERKALTQEEMTRRFKRAYPVSTMKLAQTLKDKLEESHRKFNIIEMAKMYWVLPHRVAVKTFKSRIVKVAA